MNKTEYANNLFEQPWWLDIVAPGQWKEILVRDDKGDVIARQAIVTDGKNVFMPEFTQTLGIWLSEDAASEYGKQKRAIEGILEQQKQFKSVKIDLAPDNKYILPFRWKGFVMEPQFTYRINDLSNPEALYAGFNKTAKKNIKTAKNKVVISNQADFEELWEMLNKTFKAQNRKNPLDKDLVKKIVESCEQSGNGQYFSAKDAEGNVHSCGYFVYDEKVCYYLFGASDSNFRTSGAQSLVLWEGIQFAAKHSKVFDFEGSMVEGIENFFRQFSSECMVYYEVRRQSLIREIMLLLKPKIKKLIGYKI